MKNKSVTHREPPIDSMMAVMAMIARKPSRQSGPWSFGGMRCFIGFGCPFQRAHAKESTVVSVRQHQSEEKSKALTRFTLWRKVKGMGKGKTLEVQGGETVNVQPPGFVDNGAKRKIGRPLKILSTEVTKKAIEAARLGIPLERIAVGCGFWNNGAGWQSYLARNPAFAAELEQARFEGELELTSTVRQCGNGWQGSAWLLERTRGYVARAQLDHTTKGKELSVSGSLLGAFGGQAK